jgi:hypothetical protein
MNTKDMNEIFCNERCPNSIYSQNEEECKKQCIVRMSTEVNRLKKYNLNDTDIESILSKKETLVEILQNKYGFNKNETDTYIKNINNDKELISLLYLIATRQYNEYNEEKNNKFYTLTQRTLTEDKQVNSKLKQLIQRLELSKRGGHRKTKKIIINYNKKTKRKSRKKKTNRKLKKRSRTKKRKTYKRKK